MVIFGMILQNIYETLGLLKVKICIPLSCIPYEICIYKIHRRFEPRAVDDSVRLFAI